MLAIVLVQRRDLFVPMIQPPLLLAVSVPVAIAATGSLPASGGLVSSAPAVGAPLINGFPAMAYEALADLHHPAASLLDGRTEGTLRHALSFQPPTSPRPHAVLAMAAVAVRTACAHLATGAVIDAHLALGIAHDHLTPPGAP